jgi:hypothetical protein
VTPMERATGWSTGDVRIKVAVGSQEDPILATIIVTLLPIGPIVLAVGIADTGDERVPQGVRQLSLTWGDRIPLLTAAVGDPLAPIAEKATRFFGRFASNQFATAYLSTKPEMQKTD